ncbi:MAG: glycoside hydrolase family 2 protein [Firmicutes bacterium]|nr:glycoside hydrolase family 2 protein [Bacillota bacterium]
MREIPFNFDWEFSDHTTRWFAFGWQTQKVDLPHDYIINKPRTPDSPGGASNGFFPEGQGSYTKHFDMPQEWVGKTVLLAIDGAYMNSEVFLNGDKLFHHPYGYTAYQVDLTEKLRTDITNTLFITTQSLQPSTRWYSGGGLYREVNIWLGGKQYIHPWDVFVTTSEVSAERAVVNAAVEITNTLEEEYEGEVDISIIGEDGSAVSEGHERVTLRSKDKTPISIDLTVPSPLLWDVDEPHLYTLRVVLRVEGEEADVSETTFGIRTIEIDAKNGFRLNGRKLKLRGGCIHHDNTLLGACAFPRAEERKVQILKDAGYNALRTAHNPPSRALLDACDRIGILVIDETFDQWRIQKNPLDYHLYFEKWWQHDTRAMVLRDRNHPCIYCWSIGNEIPELFGVSDGAYWTKVQADYVRSLDPTRPVTAAAHGFYPPDPGTTPEPRDIKQTLISQGKPTGGLPKDDRDPWGEKTKAPFDALDIAGYNYMYGRYAYDKEKFPERVIHGTETHSFHTYDYWQATMENVNVIGDFIWTAYDNLGEAGAGRAIYDLDEPIRGLIGDWPWLSCFQGDHDLSGNRRPQSYYRKIMWGLDDGIHMFTTHPDRTGKPFYGMGWHWEYVQRNWTFASEYVGKPVKVQAYADCDEVEFILNGQSVGKVKPEKLMAVMEIPYEPGILECVAWKGGQRVASDKLQTSGKAAKMVMTPDRSVIKADGMDLCFIPIQLFDEDGVPVVAESIEVSVKVEGAGVLQGLGSGNPKTEENYGTGKRYTFEGQVLACVRAGRTPGQIRVEATAEGLPPAVVEIRCE